MVVGVAADMLSISSSSDHRQNISLADGDVEQVQYGRDELGKDGNGMLLAQAYTTPIPNRHGTSTNQSSCVSSTGLSGSIPFTMYPWPS